MRTRLAAVFLVCFSTALAADLPSGESLIQRFIERSGGEEAYSKIHTASLTGTVEVEGQNLRGTIEMAEEGEKSWTAIDLAGIGRTEQAFDGETAWEINPIQGARLIEGEEKSVLKRSSGLALISSWKQDYSSIRTIGEETVHARPAWKVEMTPKEGRPETYLFDKDSGLLVRMSAVVSTPLGDIAAEFELSDYRSLDGIQTPFTMTQGAMGQLIVIHFDRIVYNATLPKDRFAMPAEVAALRARKRN
ncbi:MAG TPA: hypothetical protein VEF06_08430 [Bryobacteraceae bacterium]|nr:hypothetical protein [Bryobacteraceae bacterium]